MNEIDQFNKLRKLRDAYKNVMQLSFNLNLIDKKFPINTLDSISVPSMIQVYMDFYKDLKRATDEVLSIIENK